jgi:hypothetical protein
MPEANALPKSYLVTRVEAAGWVASIVATHNKKPTDRWHSLSGLVQCTLWRFDRLVR